MASAIDFKPSPPPAADPAREELDQLVTNLHEAGILRLLNDVLRASPALLEIVLKGLNTQEGSAAIQNLTLLARGLGNIPPDTLETLLDSLAAAAKQIPPERPEPIKAPGLTGAYRLLHDQPLWAGLQPLIVGLRAMGERRRNNH